MARSTKDHQKGHSVLSARSVSRGTAIGTAVCLHGRKRQFNRVSIDVAKIDKEIRRFRASIRLARQQLRKIAAGPDAASTGVFDMHLMILDDRSFNDKVERQIIDQKVNAEWAVKSVTDAYVHSQKSIADEHLREKYIDLEDIADRILTALGGGRQSSLALKRDSIVVAKELKPSTLIELTASNPRAIVTEHGGWTSHTFILARELNLPSVAGVKGVFRRIKDGDELIVDAYDGTVIVGPTPESRRKYVTKRNRRTLLDTEPMQSAPRELKTLDGREIVIRANVDIPDVYPRAKQLGSLGIGLYRSEFLFNQFKGFPSEAEQVRAYKKIAGEAAGDPVRIRTFDLSADQLVAQTGEKEKNPALGVRAIRLMLSHRKEYRTQLRAILLASVENPIDIVVPMVSDISEIDETKRLLERERQTLKKRGIEVAMPRIGAMLEVPATVMIAEEIGREVDFFCLGTNDLVQYLLAVDRDNAGVADSFRSLHPAVIRSIRTVLAAGTKCGISTVICGEMAGSPAYVALLVGLGATELSMNVNSIPRVRRTVEGIAFEEARNIVNELTACRRSDEVEDTIRTRFKEKWSHIFTDDLLPPKRR